MTVVVGVVFAVLAVAAIALAVLIDGQPGTAAAVGSASCSILVVLLAAVLHRGGVA